MKRYRQPYRQDENSPPGIIPWRIRRVTGRGDEVVEAGVIMEEPLDIRIDGQSVAILMRTPGMEKELAAGFCLGEGLVADLAEIALVRHCGRAVPDDLAESDPLDISRNRVDILLSPGAHRLPAATDVTRLIRSGCGRSGVADLAEDLVPLNAEITVSIEVLPHLLAQIARQQAAYRAAGGIHAAAVFDTRGRALVVCEDVGRHNAVDKAVGYCLLRGISLQDKLLVSTGRASYDMVAKGARLKVPILISISSPTSLAVELAEALNCTLVGYLRGKALNIYTHSRRIRTTTGEERG